MEQYILLYADKKPEDNICLTNMFLNTKKINLGWTDFDYNHNTKVIEEEIQKGIKHIIFAGLEIGWDKLIETIKGNYPEIKIKIICTTLDSLLYYDYERENFFKLLELAKQGIVQDIAFLRKGQYNLYNHLGYSCSFLRENYCLEDNKKKEIKESNSRIDIGIYPLNYTWDKNIFNQLCIPRFVKNSHLNYNKIDERMEEFLEAMRIQKTEDNIEKIEEEKILEKIIKNDVNVSCSFTEYFHTIFFLSMEQGIPCLIGNNSDLFEEDNILKKYLVTLTEDNAIINGKMVEKSIENKQEIFENYKIWKEKYNKIAKESIKEFIEK